jgi:uncharacterized protein (TIGR03067 family)
VRYDTATPSEEFAMRLVLPFLAVLLLAFAPAPFPRREQRRADDSLAVKDLVGTWRTVALLHPPSDVALDPKDHGVATVTISDARWVFASGSGFDLRIDHAKQPAQIDLMYVGQKDPHGMGIIERRGDTLRVIYAWEKRPTGFEGQPKGCYLLTLKRQ